MAWLNRILGAAFAATLLVGASAYAVNVHMFKDARSTVMTAQAIDSEAWTGWINVATKRSLVLEIAYTNSAGTAVTMRCETADSVAGVANDAGFDLHILSDSATVGTSTSTPHTWSNAVSGNESWTWTVANLPHEYVNCALTATGGDGSDVVTVNVRGVTP